MSTEPTTPEREFPQTEEGKGFVEFQDWYIGPVVRIENEAREQGAAAERKSRVDRLRECRDALEGLARRWYRRAPCWCDERRLVGETHEPVCIAATEALAHLFDEPT